MKVTREIKLDWKEEDEMERTGVCPLCKNPSLMKTEGLHCYAKSTWFKGEWKEEEHQAEEASWQRYTCSKCDFEYDINH